jgi:methyl-accepting chemotaxis protein
MTRNEPAQGETTAHPGDHCLEISYFGVPLRDPAGNVVSAVEIVTDVTAVRTAARTAKKVAEYQMEETRKLTHCLENFANGELNISVAVADGDGDTASARQSFEIIGVAMGKAVETVRSMAKDTKALGLAAAEGQLDVRADEMKFASWPSGPITRLGKSRRSSRNRQSELKKGPN